MLPSFTTISIAVVYHSAFGHTKKLAEAVARGAAQPVNSHVHLIRAEEASEHWDTLNAADALIFGSPTYMGAVSAGFKDFMDKSGNLWLKQRWRDKLAAGFTTSGSYNGDKLAVLQQLAGFAAQHGMIWISLGLKPGDAEEDGANTHVLNRLGSYLGAMARSVNDSPEVTPPQGDLDTAEFLGKRVAEMVYRFKSKE
ncbi:MAG: flavodoxin family protein [Candidatus Kapaibacterium sp.]|nr:MAG: flavodoxin family protein [Candidatus Kapabacteria bacterium]